ncbi:DUF4422 domain-containing protein [Vibrio crassostreae]|nr:DUF4422 domain-containing protein [Vibrio crassostreae]CAK3449156.1 DUF4422 domain-containing protein [Vibrio crassostreae]
MNEKDIKILCMYYRDILTDTNMFPFYNIQCGAETAGFNLGMQGDNSGDNISGENRFWSEITGLYWAWKNVDETKYIGLCSYRRFFNLKNSRKPIVKARKSDAHNVLNNIDYSCLDEIFSKSDVILPVEYTYAWSIRRVCSMNYKDDDFTLLEDYIKNNCPEYYDSYIDVMFHGNKLVGHNMFIFKWAEFQEYCDWVFDILLSLKDLINPEDYPIAQIRVFGYMHEVLLPVYIHKRKLSIYRSQILWVDDSDNDIRFNNISYQLLSNITYNSMRLLGKNYPHLLNRKK